jgi:hypothetical protein
VRTLLLSSLALALSGCGDPLFFAEVEDKQICMTLPGQSIPGAPADLAEHTVSWQGKLDLGEALPGLGEKGTTGTIRTVSLRVNSAVDLTAIRHADVELSASDGSPPTPYMHYDAQEQPAADPSVLSMTIDDDIDLFARLAGGKEIGYVISFTGRPPAADWTADITACMSARVKIDPLELISK